jgi:hypothetical protein
LATSIRSLRSTLTNTSFCPLGRRRRRSAGGRRRPSLATSTRSLRSTLTNTSLSFRKEEEEKRRREEEALIGNVYKEFEKHFDKHMCFDL